MTTPDTRTNKTPVTCHRHPSGATHKCEPGGATPKGFYDARTQGVTLKWICRDGAACRLAAFPGMAVETEISRGED